MVKQTKQLYLYDLFDAMFAELLDTDIETYSDILDNRCTFWEGAFIVMALASEREDKIEKAKQIFNSYKEE